MEETNIDPTPQNPECPSAQSSMTGSKLLGVVGGTLQNPLVSYLREPVPITPELLQLAGPVQPEEVFRFAAPCAKSDCSHFDGSTCQLATRILSMLPPVVEMLPPCKIRGRCRWWIQEGNDVCLRCPGITTLDTNTSELLRLVADPKTQIGVK